MRDVERVTPIVVRDVSIIFFHAEQPAAKNVVIDVETFDEIEIQKHSETRRQRFVVLHVYVVEFEIVQLKMRRRRHSQALKSQLRERT